MTNGQFQMACVNAFLTAQKIIPIDTGNMRYNSATLAFSSPTQATVYMNENIADYVPYTNEAWEHKVIKMGNFKKGQTVERMRTWDNPNEGWWQKFVNTFVEELARLMNGKIVQRP